ncbi:sigma-54 interaction domain-containing protein [Advenella mimigardefordensis]|uniref:Putative transcriptional regulator, Fis family n=1 Tax=Advenella mimigardefordensis (strain DSM 17166 / LMG 22922 / DPN7) TaxID=1247726 RepID=W0PBN4_ADVMD|nr:sigma-54-dependent Fis family transcriptional regulator [Advenella mimigardefordensis]AHG64151.1 putative transcriptional regulator, Fis family [Advenella mimigardefordensis DPN7]
MYTENSNPVAANRNGVLILNADCAVVFASGTGHDAHIQEKLSALWKNRATTPVSAMFTLKDVNEPITVVSYASAGAGCFVLYRADHGDPLFEFVSSVDFAANILRHFITDPYEAITVVDKQARILYMSPVHEKFFGLSRGGASGQEAGKIIENSGLAGVLRSGKTEVGQVHHMRGAVRVVSRRPIVDADGQIMGAMGQVMFKSPSALEALSEEIRRLRQEISFYERELPRLRGNGQGMEAIVGESDSIRKLKEQIKKIAPLDVSVLLVGESGVGKDLVAHAIHHLSPKGHKDMVLVNAAAIPGNLVEAELFGYEGGAFTGAEKRGRSGKFEQADNSSLFLDEIGDMPLEIQVKVLRTLQDGTFQRVGSSTQRRSNFRLISASNRDFHQMLNTGEFRLDLFYRISAVTIKIPSLRDRLEDVPILAQTFLERFMRRHNVQGKYFGPGVIAYLQSLPWPGNVRQLQHTIERAAIFSEQNEIRCEDCEVPLELQSSNDLSALEHDYHKLVPAAAADKSGKHVDVHQAKARIELDMIKETLLRFDGNKKKTAEHLGISRSHLYKKLAELDLLDV